MAWATELSNGHRQQKLRDIFPSGQRMRNRGSCEIEVIFLTPHLPTQHCSEDSPKHEAILIVVETVAVATMAWIYKTPREAHAWLAGGTWKSGLWACGKIPIIHFLIPFFSYFSPNGRCCHSGLCKSLGGRNPSFWLEKGAPLEPESMRKSQGGEDREHRHT